jgi:hypothetical protein
VTEQAENGSLIAWLRSEGVDVSLIDGEDRAEVDAMFARLVGVVDSRRKFGVDRNGYALAGAYLLEALQQLISDPD